MLKNHKLISFCIGLVFLIVLQKFATPEPIFRFLLPAFLIYVGLVTLYNSWYLKRIDKYNFWLVIRPALLLIAGFWIFLVLPSESTRMFFLISSVVVITVFEIILGSSAENFLLNETLLIAFGLFFAFTAFYQYIPAYGTWYVIGVFFASGLLARSFYEFVPQPASTKLVGSIILGLLCSELFWSLSFLPFHFSVLGLILFNFFYFCLILNYYYLFHSLNFKKIQFHLFLIAVCSLLVIAATPWNVLS